MTTPAAAIPNDLAEWMRGVEKRLRRVETAALSRDKLGLGSGDFTLTGGVFQLQDADGQNLFVLQFDDTKTKPDGDPQPFLTIQRDDDGSLAFQVYDGDPTTDGYKQFWRFFDRGLRTVVSEDVVSGFGLSRPLLGWPWHPIQVANWPSITSTAFTGLWRSVVCVANPYLDVQVLAWATTAGTTGSARVKVDGVVKGAATAFNNSLVSTLTWRLDLTDSTDVGAERIIEIETRVTAGTGAVAIAPYRIVGGAS